MNFEDMQNAWQSHDSGAKVTINADVLLKEIRRNQQQVRKTIFWRDAREIGAVVFLTLIWLHDGIQLHDWSLFLFAFVWFGAFVFQFVDRCFIVKSNQSQQIRSRLALKPPCSWLIIKFGAEQKSIGGLSCCLLWLWES